MQITFRRRKTRVFLEGRIQELENILGNVIIIEKNKDQSGVVVIGSTITVQEDTFDPEQYFIVGPKEADPRQGKISHQSPIGKAC